MKLRERIKSPSFWAGIVGAVFLMLGAFGVEMGDQTASAAVNAVCSALVVFGIVTPSANVGQTDDGERTDENDENKEDM